MPATNIINGMKHCGECKQTLAISNFRKQKRRGYFAYCNDCAPKRIRMANVKTKFGLTLQEYDLIMANGCEICGSDFRLSLDHDHNCCPETRSCGKCIRGALCMRHNLALGNVDDSIEELKALITYLERDRK